VPAPGLVSRRTRNPGHRARMLRFENHIVSPIRRTNGDHFEIISPRSRSFAATKPPRLILTRKAPCAICICMSCSTETSAGTPCSECGKAGDTKSRPGQCRSKTVLQFAHSAIGRAALPVQKKHRGNWPHALQADQIFLSDDECTSACEIAEMPESFGRWCRLVRWASDGESYATRLPAMALPLHIQLMRSHL
jgi:hypothetical protein